MTHLPLPIDRLRAAQVHQDPFWWAYLDHTFQSREVALTLQRTFPEEGYQEFQRTSGAKRHRLHGRRLAGPGVEKPTDLPEIWAHLLDQVGSPEYRAALADLSGVSLDGLGVEVTLWRQSRGGFIDPHPDNPDKVLVHLMYLSDEDWSLEMGGCMRLLRSNDVEDVAHEIPPRLGCSVLFLRSDRSWHAYKEVSTDRLRLVVQAVFHRPEMRYSSGY